MTKNEMDDITSRLKESVNYDNAYFGIVEDVPHEYCIKANEDGLKLFAAELLASTNNDKENIRGLTPEELPWFDDHIELQFIELTGKSRAELIKPVQKTTSNEWLTKLGLWTGLILFNLLDNSRNNIHYSANVSQAHNIADKSRRQSFDFHLLNWSTGALYASVSAIARVTR